MPEAGEAILDWSHEGLPRAKVSDRTQSGESALRENLSSSHHDLQRIAFRHPFAVYNGQRNVAERNRCHAEHVRRDPNKHFAWHGREEPA